MKPRLSAALCATFIALGMAMPAHAQKPSPSAALEINIGGIGPGVDAKAYAKVKLLIAEAVFSNTVSYFNVAGYGKEGGFSACIEQGRLAPEGSFERLTRALKAIRVDRSTSFYGVEAVTRCTYPVAPEVALATP